MDIMSSERWSLHYVSRQILLLMQDFTGNLHLKNHSEGRSSVRWSPPLEEWVKLNVDGSFNPLNGRGGCGGVIWDSDGVWICRFSMSSSQLGP